MAFPRAQPPGVLSESHAREPFLQRDGLRAECEMLRAELDRVRGGGSAIAPRYVAARRPVLKHRLTASNWAEQAPRSTPSR